jgi:hypothetical protein
MSGASLLGQRFILCTVYAYDPHGGRAGGPAQPKHSGKTEKRVSQVGTARWAVRPCNWKN